MSERIYFRACGFRTLGNAATPQNLLSIGVAATSAFKVVVERAYLSLDYTAILVAVAPYVRLSRPTALPSVGTVLTKVVDDTFAPLPTGIDVRGATASDGGAATAITATAGTTLAQRVLARLHTAVGERIAIPVDLLTRGRPLTLSPGEALLMQIVAASAASNAATYHYFPAMEGYIARKVKNGTD